MGTCTTALREVFIVERVRADVDAVPTNSPKRGSGMSHE